MIIMNKKIIISLGLIILIIGGVLGYYFLNLGPVSNNKEEKEITVKSGANIKSVANILKDNNLIKNKNVFLIYFKLNNLSVKAGTYAFAQSEGVNSIADKLSKGKTHDNTYWLKLIEGKTLKNYVKFYSEKLNRSEEDIIKELADQEYLKTLIKNYWFLTSDILQEDIYFPLEGYLFPDTYQFDSNSTLKNIVQKQLNNMEAKLKPYKDKVLNEGLDIHQIITAASLIEKEANSEADRRLVSSVIVNRIKIGMTLGLDVTTYYAEQVELGSVPDLHINQYKASNAYNTRGTLKGYPVGPICNPSLQSIKAALFPEESDYLYFFADIETGKVYFSKTLEQHNQIKKQYN